MIITEEIRKAFATFRKIADENKEDKLVVHITGDDVQLALMVFAQATVNMDCGDAMCSTCSVRNAHLRSLVTKLMAAWCEHNDAVRVGYAKMRMIAGEDYMSTAN